MEEIEYLIEIDGVSEREASIIAGELESELIDNSDGITAKTVQASDNSQDFGATLLISILGTPAIIALSKKIGDLLIKRNSASITIKTKKSGSVIIKNLNSSDAADLGKIWMEKYEEDK